MIILQTQVKTDYGWIFLDPVSQKDCQQKIVGEPADKGLPDINLSRNIIICIYVF